VTELIGVWMPGSLGATSRPISYVWRMQTKSVGAESNRKFESHELAVRLGPPANQIGYLEKFQHGQIIVLPKEDLVVTYHTNKPDSPGKLQLKRKYRLF
jgi:hypothetical protein